MTFASSSPNIRVGTAKETDVAVQGATLAVETRMTAQPWFRRGLGLALCVLIAAAALGCAVYAPLVGAPIFAIAIGVLIANAAPSLVQQKSLKISDTSKQCLKTGIVLLGASLNLGDIVHTGLGSLPLLLVTMSGGLICSLVLGKMLGIEWRMRCLIGIGTTICGGSAIAALAPVIRAKAEEIAYAITVVFFFNMVAVFTFPALGHLLGLSDNGFGVWAGTAVNDTSAVVAAGFAFSQAAGTTATIVKLTRTTLIIPLVLAFGLALPFLGLDEGAGSGNQSLAKRVYAAVPTFIILFVLAATANTFGLIGSHAGQVQLLGRLVMVVALAAVGLQGHWRAFVGAGSRPLVLGMATWFVVAVSSLAVQSWTGSL
ncbi:MAG TPA: putative sulfate exporter family transporter [Rhodopila sp.]|nr:putative sulfate exporter family transporter [Rhodopila sp.]